MTCAHFHKVLIANRGEIAQRVQRSAAAAGYRTVAVYSEADADLPFVQACDQAVALAGATPAESYLNIEALIAAAKASGADAVHPGYGFLSEQAAFADACLAAGLVWIGPSPQAIRAMADKAQAKHLLRDADVPLIPGVVLDLTRPDSWRAAAEELGFPVLIKAAAGGGGRGMRLVEHGDDLEDAVSRARSEALNAFGHDGLLLEKALLAARHIEIQVVADRHGNRIHLGERDCSLQRRHQKVVEEAPSPAVDARLRGAMGAVALKIAERVDYDSVGTVEFLLDEQGAFYFLEMNTRLQVEHGVTEMVTGCDLVQLQFEIAQGRPLRLRQEDVALNGHAVQVRLYAEDPEQNYLPQTGTVHAWRPASAAGVRIDHGLADGVVVSAFYDAMVAKVMAWGRDRDTALARLRGALEQTHLLGVTTNQHFLAQITANPGFVAGRFSTQFLAQTFAIENYQRPRPTWAELGAAWLARRTCLVLPSGVGDEWRGWFSANAPWRQVRLVHGAGVTEFEVRELGRDALAVRYNGEEGVITQQGCVAATDQPFQLDVAVAGCRRRWWAVVDGETVALADGHTAFTFHDESLVARNRTLGSGNGQVQAVMSGRVVTVAVTEGDHVNAGQLIAVLEAMKMEHRLLAPIDGTVTQVAVAAGDQVQSRQLLLAISPASSS